MNITTVREGLAEVLAEEITSSPTLPDMVTDLPFAAVGMPKRIEFFASMGRDRIELPVTLLVSRLDAEDAQAALDALLSRGTTGNIITLLNQLRPAWGTVKVASATDLGEYEVGGIAYIGATINVEIYA